MPPRLLILTLLLAAPASALYAEQPASPHPVVAELIETGFNVGEGVMVTLPAPLLRAEMTAEQEVAALKSIAKGPLYDRFVDDSVSARQEFAVSVAKKLPSGATVRQLDQYFIAHGGSQLIGDKKLLEDFMTREKKQAEEDAEPEPFAQYMEVISPAEKPIPAGQPYLYRYRYALIDKVVISGLIRGQTYEGERVVIESAVSPIELLDDATNPTVSRLIPRRAEGDADLEPAKPFRGLAGYLQVTELKSLPGAALVECHGVLVEPKAWFGGRNLLGSKLAFVARDNVRTLRRKLDKLRAEQTESAEQAAQP